MASPRFWVSWTYSAGTRHDGIRDVFAYLRDSDNLFRDHARPRAFVVAWNSRATHKDTSAECRVVNQSTFMSEVGSMLKR
jgi:hypothetical protein